MASPSRAGIARPAGLTTAEVADRVRQGLVNRDRPPVDRTYLRILLDHALPPVNIALYAVSVALLLMSLEIDALVTAGPVVAYVLIGIWQEARAKRQLDSIALLHRPQATVIRDGVEREVDTGAIVLGEAVLLRRGDEIGVDGRLMWGEIEIYEGSVTGESDPVARRVGDRVRSGTACLSGQAVMEADRIGSVSTSATMLRAARAVRAERTPIQGVLQRVILSVTGIVALAGVIVAARLIGAEAGVDEAAQAAAVLVALVPQGLLVVLTITYAMGALELTRQGALVQRIGAIEAMSHVDTLCVDKTGTLTTGRIRLLEADSLGGSDGLADVAASLEPPNATLLAVRADRPGRVRACAWQVAFSSSRGWSALRFADGDGAVHLLGAPDVLLGALEPTARDRVAQRVADLARRGRRVLLHAKGPSLAERPDALPQALEPITLLGFAEDPCRDARRVMNELTAAGAELKVMSGDDPRTLEAVAVAAGITSDTPARTAVELVSDAEATAALVRGTLFGRTDPEQKARFIALLRAAGRYVGMIGDGVNDILALKGAQLGIAMASGSAATRAVADIVLLTDDFALLPSILRAGKRVVSAMMVTLELLLARTFSMILIVTVAAVFALPFPFTPRNNSLLALLTVGIPTVLLALAVAPARPPRQILRSALRFAVPSGIGIALPALVAYAISLRVTDEVVVSRTVLLDLTLFFGIGLITLVAQRWTRPVVAPEHRWRLWLLAVAMASAFGIVLALPPVRSFFELASMPAPLIGLLAFIGLGWTVTAHLATDRISLLLGRVERWGERLLGARRREAGA